MSAPNNRGEISVSGLTVDEIVRASIEQARGVDGERLSIKQVAALCNIPAQRLYEIAAGTRNAWANEVSPLVHGTGSTAIADGIERDLFRVGVPLPRVPASEGTVLARTAEACGSFGLLMKNVSESSTQGFNRHEARSIRSDAEELIALVLATVHEIESVATDSSSLLRRTS